MKTNDTNEGADHDVESSRIYHYVRVYVKTQSSSNHNICFVLSYGYDLYENSIFTA